jgi:hypothetical protein
MRKEILILKLIIALLAVVVVALWAVMSIGEAQAKPVRWDATPATFKIASPASTQVWITPETTDKNLAEAVWYAAAFWNGYTKTKLNCTTAVITEPKPMITCAPTPCVTNSYCLRVKWGDLPAGQVARYEPVFCAGGCVRAGMITVDPAEVPFGGVHPWGPTERAMVIQHYIGRFIGIAVNPNCTSVMYASLSCPTGGRAPNVLTAAEATQAGVW